MDEEPPPPKDAPPRVELDWNSEPDALYANVLVMSPTMPDIFSLLFADASMLRPTGDDGVVLANIVSSLRVPASSMEEFIASIVAAWNEYASANPSKNLKRFREE